MIAIHIVSAIDKTSIDDWCGFAKAAGRDLRVAVLMPVANWMAIAEPERATWAASGVGVFIAHPDQIEEIAEPRDLGMNVDLPPLERMPRDHRIALAAAYDHFEHDRWREGFDEACRAVESQARTYLIAAIRSTRVTMVDRHGNNITPTTQRVRRMTLGALVNQFKQILNQTGSDVFICKTLASINTDRIGRAHGKRAVEKRLRLNVGRHMHVIVSAFKHLLP